MEKLSVLINPLKFLQLDIPPHKPYQPGSEDVLGFLSEPMASDSSTREFCNRYEHFKSIEDPFPVVPYLNEILEKFVWPLKNAKGSYALGNYLGCIALCGFVGEMAAVLRWDISKYGRDNNRKAEQLLFGRSFEKLGQERRVSVLRGYRLIDDDAVRHFDVLRERRGKYLHYLSHSHEQIAHDALATYAAAVGVVKAVLTPTFIRGKMVINIELREYLSGRGILIPEEGQGEVQAPDESP